MSHQNQTEERKLHLGCGRDIKSGWINLDHIAGPGVDVVADLDDCANTPLPFEDDSIDEILASHLIEHLKNPLPFMQELHRISKPGAQAVFRVPYGSTDDAFTDPTHVQRYFIQSWGYFSQPLYWRADYGYRGDWDTGYLLLHVDGNTFDGCSPDEILNGVMTLRNVVTEMTAVLTAVKPIRPADKELQTRPQIEFELSPVTARATS
jgi:SAM-dependent methyltransferase